MGIKEGMVGIVMMGLVLVWHLLIAWGMSDLYNYFAEDRYDIDTQAVVKTVAIIFGFPLGIGAIVFLFTNNE